MNNTINNVPRELMERARAAVAATNTSNWSSDLLRDIHAILSAPSPAGDGGLPEFLTQELEAVGQEAVAKAVDDQCSSVPVLQAVYGEAIRKRVVDDAQAVIDGLRGEVADLLSMLATVSKAGLRVRTERDQQAQRIGELEGLLLRVQVSLSLDDTEWGYSGAEKYKLLADIRAALSAGKEGE